MKFKCKTVVRHYLKNHTHLRDDDNKLIASIWKSEIKRMDLDPNKMTAFELLELYAKGKLTNSESIRRVRQKIQAEEPSLRGERYDKRQKSTKQVREALGYRA